MTRSVAAVTKATAGHYSWGDGCEGWHFADEPGLAVIRERMPPGTSETPHLHDRATQFFFVLGGHAAITVGKEVARVGPGQGLTVRPGISHTVRNDGSEALELIVVSAPPTRNDRRNLPSSESPNDQMGVI